MSSAPRPVRAVGWAGAAAGKPPRSTVGRRAARWSAPAATAEDNDMRPSGSSIRNGRSVPEGSGRAARAAGALLVVAAAATAVGVLGRLSAGADQPALVDSLTAIADNAWRYGSGGAGRWGSGLALMGAALCMAAIGSGFPRPMTPLAVVLLAVSGFVTAVSGAYAVVMAVAVHDVADPGALSAAAAALEGTARSRAVFGAGGFMLAGWALIAAAPRQWRLGGAWKRLAPVSGVLGLAMQLIWIDAATAVHRVTGVVFMLWLVAAGVLLRAARSESEEQESP